MMDKPFSKLNFSLPFGMDTAVPVDYNSFFTSYSEASAAAATAVPAGSNESIYYIGQQVFVVDDEKRTVKSYLISHDKKLQDTGSMYTFAVGLSSDGFTVGLDTTNIVAPSSSNSYFQIADAKYVEQELCEKADAASLYPRWTSKSFDAWKKGEICSWNGKLYVCIDDENWVGQSDITPDISEYWNVQILGELFQKYDAALYPLAYTGDDTVTVGEIATVLGWKGDVDEV